MAKSERIATVKASGLRYIVQAVDFKKDVVHVWGEVSSVRNLSTKHEKSLSFPLKDVEMKDWKKTQDEVNALFHQSLDQKKKAGWRVVQRGKHDWEYFPPERKEALGEQKKLMGLRPSLPGHAISEVSFNWIHRKVSSGVKKASPSRRAAFRHSVFKKNPESEKRRSAARSARLGEAGIPSELQVDVSGDLFTQSRLARVGRGMGKGAYAQTQASGEEFLLRNKLVAGSRQNSDGSITWLYRSKADREKHVGLMKRAAQADASKYGRFKQKYGATAHKTQKSKAMAYGGKEMLKQYANWEIAKEGEV